MGEAKSFVAKMTIDLKRNRFRIFSETLKQLGNPNYIQFLINPEELFIAILGSDRPLAGGTANKIPLHSARGSAEFYSASLMSGIFNIYGVLDFRFSYRLTGEIDAINRVAYFSLRSIRKIERGTVDA
ncbi:hypothetical protein [Neglectibacter caecimuris]|jgi:hypothetical protein|uniref:hypothetical protein n=1 Tax=Neglectibacter caecimuris TaxID=3093658 RepID=UPI002AC929E0|nr:hypothetical protein [Neglectibacter sp. M00184]